MSASQGPPAQASSGSKTTSDRPEVVVVVPTRNSERTLGACLQSLRRQSLPCRVIVVDNFSDDRTAKIAAQLADVCLSAGPERSRQRNVGARSSSEPIVGFIDSDMVLDPSVAAEVVAAIDEGAGMVTVPERSVGEGYWARVRAHERAFYDGRDDVEAPRFFRRDVFEEVGGFDEELDAAEDWDLALRARPLAPSARTTSGITHLEGAPTFRQCCAKKAGYALGIRGFAEKHGIGALRRAARRPYVEAPWRLVWPHPILGAGVVALKCGETAAVAWRLVRDRSDPPRTSVSDDGATRHDEIALGAARGLEHAPVEAVRGAARRTCELVVPAYNEANRLGRALDSVLEAPLPAGWAWTHWSVLDGASDDGTPEFARSWAATHRSPPLSVVTAPHRRGKAAELGDWHRRLLCTPGLDQDHVILVLDADVAVEPRSIAALLAPFANDAELAVVWGVDSVDRRTTGYRASAFRVEAVSQLARLAGPNAPRAYGRFFAYRPARLAGFCWDAGQVDDLQLARHAAAHGLTVRSAWDATVRVTPARGYRNLSHQTYRSFDARAREQDKGEVDATDPLADRLLAAALVARHDPGGALAYALARIVCAGMHLLRPTPFSDAWDPALTTKEAVGAPEDRQEHPGRGLRAIGLSRAVGAKLLLAWRCRHELVNWPLVLMQVLAGWLGWEKGTFRAVSRTGAELHAPNTAIARWPLIEVLADDVYKLRGRTFDNPDAPRVVLDVGAHVGSFTCALAPRLPGARFVCVEPSPVTATWLRHNLSRSGLEQRASVVQAAVGDAEGWAVLAGGDDASCEATTIARTSSSGPVVRVTTLDALITSLGEVPDLVKLDCEGGEYAAILSSSIDVWRRVEEVLLEYHPVSGHHFDELRSRLGAAGLELVWQVPSTNVPGLGMASFRRGPDPWRQNAFAT